MQTYFTNFQTLIDEMIQADTPETKEALEEIQAQAQHPDEQPADILYRLLSTEFADHTREGLGDTPTLRFDALYDESDNVALRSAHTLVWGVGVNASGQTVYFTALGNVVVTL